MEIYFVQFNFVASFLLLSFGLFLMIVTGNLIKKLFGLAIFQTAILLFLISLGKINGAVAPIIEKGASEETIYANPLPQVLVLTAIVVGLAILSVGLALTIRIKKAYGSIEEENLNA